MKSFTDNRGRIWTLSIHVGAIKKVKSLTGLDLIALVTDGFKGINLRAGQDVVQFVDALYVLCKEQADSSKITDEEFASGLAGDALAAATEAFAQELIDFFPKGQRETMLKARQKLTSLERMAQQNAIKRLDEMTEEELMKSIEAFMSAPASLESIRTHSPGGN